MKRFFECQSVKYFVDFALVSYMSESDDRKTAEKAETPFHSFVLKLFTVVLMSISQHSADLYYEQIDRGAPNIGFHFSLEASDPAPQLNILHH